MSRNWVREERKERTDGRSAGLEEVGDDEPGCRVGVMPRSTSSSRTL